MFLLALISLSASGWSVLPESNLKRRIVREVTTRLLRREQIAEAIRVASSLLPANGNLRHFRHCNPLRAYEGLPFDQAVREATRRRGASPYISEQHYCEMLTTGQVELDDVIAFLSRDLGPTGNDDVAGLTTRIKLRQSMIHQVVAESADLESSQTKQRSETEQWGELHSPDVNAFHVAASPASRARLIRDVHHCIDRAADDWGKKGNPNLAAETSDALVFWGKLSDGAASGGTVSDSQCLQFLWRVCRDHLAESARGTACSIPLNETELLSQKFTQKCPRGGPGIRHRDLLLQLTGVDTDKLVHTVLVPFLSGFLDQGQVKWGHWDRGQRLLKKFAEIFGQRNMAEARWLQALTPFVQQLQSTNWDALECIEHSLMQLGISEANQDVYLSQAMLALPGWTGVVNYLEQGAEWMTWPVASGTLHELVALRLILDRVAAEFVSRQLPGFSGSLDELFAFVSARRTAEVAIDETVAHTAVVVFQLAQINGWTASNLCGLTTVQWRDLSCEVQSFSVSDRLQCFQKAIEESYRRRVLDAIVVQASQRAGGRQTSTPQLQVVCCTDTCSESLRRHLEEVCGTCETFGTPGFFGLAMSFRALGETHFSPHCPTNVIPRHYVQELPGLNSDGRSQPNPRARGTYRGKSPFRTLELSSLLENWLSTPRLTRLLFPGITRRLGMFSGSQWQSPRSEQLDWQATTHGLQGYSLDEMVDAVHSLLTGIGLVNSFAPLILLLGHVSISVNNPFSAADSCAFCSGRSGGPNARTMALMANDYRVREQLRLDGLEIPDTTVFIAAEHETCGDTIEYFDLTHLSLAKKSQLPFAIDAVDEALRRNAHERCRRFDNVSLTVTRERAAMLVEDRAVDLTELCAEYSQVGNGICFVGSRERTKGLFMDRRAFLASYESCIDDEEGTVLGKLLKTVIPTCVSVNLQYYFAAMNPKLYGAGSRLHHSVVSMLGVTNGACEDLCVGLPDEMLRDHQPQRLSCIIETTPQILSVLLSQNPLLRRLCDNEWLFLSTLDPDSNRVHSYERGAFYVYRAGRTVLPEVTSSEVWYRGQRGDLSFATIRNRGTGSL